MTHRTTYPCIIARFIDADDRWQAVDPRVFTNTADAEAAAKELPINACHLHIFSVRVAAQFAMRTA